ncbi:MAG: PQQ-binding-like beta-propeller repeat protein [Acidobacteria bacterium]|nr:PQQ-binding-like beta-propeller repeat protein [Acidobacteriota bacterium]
MIPTPHRTAALAVAAACALTLAPAAQDDGGYTPVTTERLQNPEPDNWLMYRRTYDGWGYSPLDQITTANVGRLKPVWTFSTGVREGHEAPPVVNDGRMFVTTPQNQVFAFDAATGDLLWRYARELPAALQQLHPTNRGVALYGDKVYIGTVDSHVVALDAATGDVVWEQAVEDPAVGYYITMAPLVADGKVMVGTSGGELGIRGFVAALDAETGNEVWKTYTIPAPDEPGGDTWPGDTWRTGGASVWATATYDPELNQTYWGTGNPGPWMGDARPGDNLYTNSVLAPRRVDRGDRRLSPVPLERLVGLGRDRSAPADRRRAERPRHPRPGAPRAERLPLDSGARAGRHRVRRRRAVRLPERLHRDRPAHRTALVRSRAHARHRQAGQLLPLAHGRQELASGGVQPRDPAALHPGHRERLHLDGRTPGRVHPRAHVHRGPIHL